jgi:hypothetical protein
MSQWSRGSRLSGRAKLMVLAFLLIYSAGCGDEPPHAKDGGEVRIAPGFKLVTASVQGYYYTIVTRPMRAGEVAEEYDVFGSTAGIRFTIIESGSGPAEPVVGNRGLRPAAEPNVVSIAPNFLWIKDKNLVVRKHATSFEYYESVGFDAKISEETAR